MTTNGHLPETQRAAQYSPETNSISVNTIPVPKPTKDQLLIKVASSSLCHSDLMLLEPNETGLKLGDGRPVTIGHEATGVILSVPESCTDPTLKVGARVGFLCAEDVCYECYGCQIHNSWCTSGKTVMSGFGRDGFFQEYVASNWRNAVVIPDELDIYEAAPLFCAGITSWDGVIKAKINPGEWMAIVGCGGLGHLGIQYAKALGYKVIGIDVVDTQLEEAKVSGADYTFNSMKDKDYVKKIKEITDGGCHAAVNYTASKPAYDATPILLRAGGIMMVVGIPQKPLEINALEVALGKYRIGGGNNSIPQKLSPMLEFSAKHHIKPHVTFYQLDEINHMIDLMHAGKARGRLAVKFQV